MDRKLALGLFLATCIILAILLIMQIIGPVVSSLIFAVALVLFGGLSRGFRKEK
jgi:membrane glycosyltransferase